MREIVILSGKGGTGKTSVCAAFATLGMNKVVADCDVETANLYLILEPDNFSEESIVTGQSAEIKLNECNQCGLCADMCRFDAVRRTDNGIYISATACEGCGLCFWICPVGAIQLIKKEKSRCYTGIYRNGRLIHARLEPGEGNSGKLVSVVRKRAREIAMEMGSRTIIIDGPPGIGCPAISSLTGAEIAVIVTEPTNSGLHDLKRILALTNNFKIRSSVVINKYDLNSRITGEILNWCESVQIPVTGFIPFEPEFVYSMIQCRSIVEWKPDSAASIEIRKIWKAINENE